MRIGTCALLVLCLLCSCKGVITSPEPLLARKDAAFPLTSGTEILGSTLSDDGVWEIDARPARVLLEDGAYRLITPDQPEPSSERFILKRASRDEYVVQGRNGNEWAYGLIVHAGSYYVFTFNHTDQTCTDLSSAEQQRLHMTIRDDQCYVTSVRDLIDLLRTLRRKFPRPTSVFSAR